MKIGVLAIQGSVTEHLDALKKTGVRTIEVRKPEQLEEADGLIIPGGESTTIGKMMVKHGILEPLRNKCREGFPVFGTCAGLVLLSKKVEDGLEEQPLLNALDIIAQRNAFGRQVDSFEADLDIPVLGDQPFHAVFIRAPIIKTIQNGVSILARVGDTPVAVLEKNILATAFHPELTDDLRFHLYFIQIVMESKN